MLIYERVSETSRSLRLTNPESLDKAEYKRLLSRFEGAAGNPNKKLVANLRKFGDDPENANLPCDGDLRAGYVGLNRWCLTDAPKFESGRIPAEKLWKFLFNEFPTTLAGAPGSGSLVLREGAWNDWYERVSGARE
mgnify:CR=1 FL=1